MPQIDSPKLTLGWPLPFQDFLHILVFSKIVFPNSSEVQAQPLFEI